MWPRNALQHDLHDVHTLFSFAFYFVDFEVANRRKDNGTNGSAAAADVEGTEDAPDLTW